MAFDPSQPRVPKGSGDPSGEWTKAGGGGGQTVVVERSAISGRVEKELEAAKLPASHTEGLRGVIFADSSSMGVQFGRYSVDGKIITLTTDVPQAKAHLVENAVIHEIGHHVHVAKMTTRASNEWARLSNDGKAAKISAYARSNRGEHFAEAYRAYNSGTTNRSKLRELEPKSYKFMQDLMKPSSTKVLPPGQFASTDSWRDRYGG